MSEFSFFSFSDYEFHTNESAELLGFPFGGRFQPTRRTTNAEVSTELNVPYTIFEILVAIFAIIGNLMVIIVFQRERKLRRRTNYYIVSLAMADFLVGLLGVPFAILASVGLPTNLHACLFTVSLLVVLCTISIFCLVAVSVDRYWAILYPMAYSRNVRTKTAIGIISMCWVAGTIVGFLPLFGWHANVVGKQACLFVEVMDYNYLVFLYFATIITPALLMLAFYAHIYRVIIKQVRQIVTMNPVGDCSRRSSVAHIQTTPNRMGQGGTMLRVLGAARKRDVKATQNLSIIVLFFMICWIPLYTINCIKAFCPDCYVHPKLTFFCIILSHLNSAVNPVLYAYHLKDFRAALKSLILKVIGIDVDPQPDMTHRFSLASQHRLQSINKRSSVKTKIYIDSPIWLRQQQQKQQQDDDNSLNCEPTLISNSLSSVHQTVAAVASATSDFHHNMWNIVEASSTAEQEHSIGSTSGDGIGSISGCGSGSRSANGSVIGGRDGDESHVHSNGGQRNHSEHDSQYSYDNQNYSSSPDDLDYDDVFINVGGKKDSPDSLNSSLKCSKLHHSDDEDEDIPYQIKYISHLLTDSSISDYEIPKNLLAPAISQAAVQTYSPIRNGTTTNHVPTKLIESTDCTNYKTCLARGENEQQMASIFVVDSEKNPLSPGHKPRFKKSPRLSITNSNTRAARKITRSSSCTTDTDLYNNNNHADKFSPFKAMSNLIFPPVKHSSLFQLFVDPCRDNGDCSDTKKRTPSDD